MVPRLQNELLQSWNVKEGQQGNQSLLKAVSALGIYPSPELLQAFIFSQHFFLLLLLFIVPPENHVCVSVHVPHWGIKRQADSIKTDLIVRWRDSVERLWMCWRSTRTIKVLRDKSQGMKGAGVIACLGVGDALWGSHAKLLPHYPHHLL